ncbi:MAG: FGGY-family carbohydrate kinase [Leptolyngbya sp. SIO1D8]|nr:FGGY-family carbohydrate kinase [Leptolyngbya sp. SIO1D8]
MVYIGGLDFGTSGARMTVIDTAEMVVAQTQVSYALDTEKVWHHVWLAALAELLQNLPVVVRQALGAIAFNGTSATVLLCDEAGEPVTDPLLYNDPCGQAHCFDLIDIAPPGSPVLSATSSLAKLLWWQATLPPNIFQQAHFLMHQADWLAFQLHGQPGFSDYHNALKLGYDVGHLGYPDWLLNFGQPLRLTALLPQVQAPGTLLGRLTPAASDRYSLPVGCAVIAGTTDSIAAFWASGAQSPGEAVTSLGSTLVVKLLSNTRVDDERYGIYSHRWGDLWLVGGASNTGGNVLTQFFSDAQLKELSLKIPGHVPSGLNYYPLSQPGERFPISDPSWPPQLTPRPQKKEQFLHGLLEGIARIEAQGYQLLQDLGATPLTKLFSAGGGAHNPTWTTIRQRYLSVPMETAASTDASFGTARLALAGWHHLNKNEGVPRHPNKIPYSRSH